MEKIRILQLKELEMLKQFAAYCDAHDLRYYLLGGTLLGAIRHGGFIPWDDDVDVAMPRPDYNRFLKEGQSFFNGDVSIINYDLDEDYNRPFGRLNDSSMQVINHSANKQLVEPISIDLIPLDGFPDGKLARHIHKMRLSFWWNMNQLSRYDDLVNQERKRSKKEQLFVKLAGAFKWAGKLINTKKCLKNLHKALEKYPYDSNTKEVINYLAAYGFSEIFPRKAIGKGKTYQFEDASFIGPEDYDAVCTIIYGDYMTPPPENERNWHNTEIV